MPRRVYHYNKYKKPRRGVNKSWKVVKVLPSLVVLAVVGVIIFNAGAKDLESVDEVIPNIERAETLGINTNLPKPTLNPKWPKNIQSAVGAVGYGVLAESNQQAKPAPMASLAKVMPAILMIEKDGITKENDGGTITFTKDDVAIYDKYLLKEGVVHEVKPGSTLSQKKALQAMLISSSNNIADSAVINSFGSIEAYLGEANKKAKELGMENTVYADVTGFSPQTKSTASDLIILSEYAMRNSLFREIVSTWQVKLNPKTTLTNTNSFLDFENNNVIGIKTGLTDEAGGTYMSAARYKTKDGDVIALAVTLGAKNHFGALKSAQPLLQSVGAAFKQN